MMPGWLVITLAIVLLAAAAAFRERSRVRGLEGAIGAHGFHQHPSLPADLAEAARALTTRFHPGPARLWGVVLDGTLDGRRYLIAEYEASPSADMTGVWSTMIMSPTLPGAIAGEASTSLSAPAHHSLANDATFVRHDGYDAAHWRGTLSTEVFETLMRVLPDALAPALQA